MRQLVALSMVGLVIASSCGPRSANEPKSFDPVVRGKRFSEWVEQAKSSDPYAATEAFGALSDDKIRDGDGADLAIAALVGALGDRVWDNRRLAEYAQSESLLALVKYGNRAEAAVPAVDTLLKRHPLDVRLRDALTEISKVFWPRGESKKDEAIRVIRNIRGAIDLYIGENNAMPRSLGALAEAEAPSEPIMDHIPLDPWGRRFDYKIVNASARTYQLSSAGQDEIFGTEDDVKLPEK